MINQIFNWQLLVGLLAIILVCAILGLGIETIIVMIVCFTTGRTISVIVLSYLLK